MGDLAKTEIPESGASSLVMWCLHCLKTRPHDGSLAKNGRRETGTALILRVRKLLADL